MYLYCFSVALTACYDGGSLSDNIVKFSEILTNTGVNNIVSFKSTGKFVCEFPGLYFISANIRSNHDDFPYYLMKNSGVISRSAFTAWPSSTGKTTTGISAAVDCQKNDVLYISIDSSYNLESTWSCFTVTKIH